MNEETSEPDETAVQRAILTQLGKLESREMRVRVLAGQLHVYGYRAVKEEENGSTS